MPPRFVARGRPGRLPYLVMTTSRAEPRNTGWTTPAGKPASAPGRHHCPAGQAMAQAAHSLHQQNAVHLDLKPANVLLRPDGSAVLLDFGLSWHAHYPDLLAEELRPAIGSPAWMAPEQVVGVRGDPRSDIFAIGVML